MLLYSLKDKRSPAQCECAFRVYIGREVQNKICELKFFAGSSGSCVNSYLGENL